MADIKVLGSLESKFESRGGVYDVFGCSPTLDTAQGGNKEPKILEAKQLGFMDNGTGKHQSNTVYDENALCPNITTVEGGGTQQIKICESQIPCKLDKMPNGHLDSLDNAKICDIDTPTASTVTARYYKGIGAHKDNMCIVAMRGRNPDNPSDRATGSPTEQRLEVNKQGTSNCLTSVQKDNLVMESQVLTPKRTEYGKHIRKAYESGQIQESRHNMTELEPRKDNISNTLTTVQKDNLLLENVLAVDEQNMNVRKETFGTLTTDGSSPKHNNRVMIKQATKDGSIECEIGGCFDASYPNSKTRRGRVQDKGNTCPTLTAQNQEVVRIEKVGQISSNGSQCGTVISDNGISVNLVAGKHGYANSHIATQYRIRKLTPRECGRLMGASDEDIDKMAAVNSNTQLYKQFGNSIVVDVMCAMFKNLNINQ